MMITRQRARIAALILGLLLIQGLALTGYQAWEAGREDESLSFRFERIGGSVAAPALSLERADGTRVTVTPGKDGNAVLVHFWATWCPPCRDELPALLALGKDISPSGRVRIVAVATDPGWQEIRTFFNGEPPPEVLRDYSGNTRRDYRVSALPDTYLVTADGLIRIRFAGAQAWGSKSAREFLAREANGGHS